MAETMTPSSGMITRRAKVDPGRTPEQVLNALGRRQYVDREVVKTMPRGQGAEGDVLFFCAHRSFISDDDLEAEFESRGLVPADPYKVAAVNQDDPSFADEHPNATHWKDSRGRWCYFVCYRLGGERGVDVDRYGHDWDDRWWFAGVRKFSDS